MPRTIDYADPRNWKYSSPTSSGLHLVVSPDNSACKTTWVYRLNLNKGEHAVLGDARLEMNPAVISGSVTVSREDERIKLQILDSFYLPGGEQVTIEATENSVLFIGAGPYEELGSFFVRKFEADLPLGEIHQIHGEPPYEREVFMTLNQEVEASRMVNGFTWGAAGMWTSWPPHQHSAHLEEVYCYFDLPAPRFALHLASRSPGTIEAVHPVSSGDFVIIPEGYHPTVSCPGARSSYFWVMVAHDRASRRYDLAKADFGL